jgi:hypothetical protein
MDRRHTDFRVDVHFVERRTQMRGYNLVLELQLLWSHWWASYSVIYSVVYSVVYSANLTDEVLCRRAS